MEFLFDYISSYAYIAWTQIHGLAKRFGLQVDPIPILFAGLLNSTGQKGPAEVPSERAYIIKDLLRTSHALDIPFAIPPSHPFNPLAALRVTCAVSDLKQKCKLTDHLFQAVWGQGLDISDPDVLISQINQAGFEVEPLLAQSRSEEVKSRLKNNTDRALVQGVFGVPTIFVKGEMFWGYESFQNLERFLAGKDHVDPALAEKWANIKPSATRR